MLPEPLSHAVAEVVRQGPVSDLRAQVGARHDENELVGMDLHPVWLPARQSIAQTGPAGPAPGFFRGTRFGRPACQRFGRSPSGAETESMSNRESVRGPSGVPLTDVREQPGRVEHLPAYRVLLHNDDKNDFVHVIETLVDLTPLSPQAATTVTMEAHKTGVALVLTTHRERAELYVDQFKSKSLKV